jgi:hypothetical protein
MENNSEEHDDDFSLQDFFFNYIVRPAVRGLSFGLPHYFVFVLVGPYITKKLNIPYN